MDITGRRAPPLPDLFVTTGECTQTSLGRMTPTDAPTFGFPLNRWCVAMRWSIEFWHQQLLALPRSSTQRRERPLPSERSTELLAEVARLSEELQRSNEEFNYVASLYGTVTLATLFVGGLLNA